MKNMTAVPSFHTDDETLITLLCEQPAIGIAHVYDRYGRVAYSMPLRIVQDYGSAEEITQNVFLHCWKNAASFHPNVAAWHHGC